MSKRPGWQRAGVVIAVLLIGTTAGAGIVYLIKSMIGSSPGPVKQIVQEVRIIRPPPPPEVEPPPPEVQDEVDVPEPEREPDVAQNDTPPEGPLGLDAEGAAGADGFGLAARKGGRDLLGSGAGAFAAYTGLLKNEILDRLQENKRARSGAYSIVVRLWLSADGRIERVKLASSTGDSELDAAIESALSGIDRVAQAPPIEMPQPVSLRIVSRI